MDEGELEVPSRAGIPGFAHSLAEKKQKKFALTRGKKKKEEEKTAPQKHKYTKKDGEKHPFCFALTREIKPLTSTERGFLGFIPRGEGWELASFFLTREA